MIWDLFAAQILSLDLFSKNCKMNFALIVYSMEYAYSGTLTPDFSLDDVKSMFTFENNKRYYLYKDFPIVSIGKNTDAFLLRIAYPKSKGMHGVNPGSGIKVGNYINNVKFHP